MIKSMGKLLIIIKTINELNSKYIWINFWIVVANLIEKKNRIKYDYNLSSYI